MRESIGRSKEICPRVGELLGYRCKYWVGSARAGGEVRRKPGAPTELENLPEVEIGWGDGYGVEAVDRGSTHLESGIQTGR